MNHDRTPAALRLLRNQPNLTAWAVARRLNMDRAAARVMLLEAESAGLLTVSLGTVSADHGTQAKRYAPAVPWLTPSQRRVFSAIVAHPGIHAAPAVRYADRPLKSTVRLISGLEKLGLIETRMERAVVRGIHCRVRACRPAPWVLA